MKIQKHQQLKGLQLKELSDIAGSPNIRQKRTLLAALEFIEFPAFLTYSEPWGAKENGHQVVWLMEFPYLLQMTGSVSAGHCGRAPSRNLGPLYAQACKSNRQPLDSRSMEACTDGERNGERLFFESTQEGEN